MTYKVWRVHEVDGANGETGAQREGNDSLKHSGSDPGLETSLPSQSCHDVCVLCDDDDDSMVHGMEDMDHKHGCLPTDPEEHQRWEQKILTSRLPFMFNYYAI